MIVQSLLDFLSHGWDIREKTREVAQVIAEMPSGILLAVELREVLAGDGDGFFRLSHGNSIAEFRVKRSFKFVFFSVDSSLGKLMLAAIFIDHDDDVVVEEVNHSPSATVEGEFAT